VRAARFLLFGVIGLLLLALAAVWLVPGQLDWDRYRSTVEAIASSALGRRVTIAGPIELSLLPDPEIVAGGVDVAGASDGSGAILRVRALRLRVALAPLLSGRIVPRELVLRQPELRLPWPLPDRIGAREEWSDTFSARIDDGRLSIGQLAFTAVDATLTRSETGALAVSGTVHTPGLRVPDLGWHFTARLTSPGGDGGQGLDVTLDGQGREASGVGATFSGQLAPDGTLAGRVAGRGPDLSLFLPAPPVSFKAEGRLTAAGGLVAADDLALDIGGSPVRGAVALRVSPIEHMDIALAAGRLDLDRWLPVLRAGQGLSIPVSLDLSAEAAQLGGGTIRRLRAALDLGGDVVTLRETTAILPGEADLRLSGRLLRADPAHPRFDGAASLEAPDLRATLRWLDPGDRTGLGRLPSETLRRVSLRAASVSATTGEVTLHRLEGSADGSPLAGTVALHAGEHPWFDVDLSLDRLALDPWLPEKPPPLTAWPGLLSGVLKIRAKQATAWARSIDGFVLDAAARDGTLALRALEGTVEGVRASLTGTVGEGGRIGDGKLTVSTRNAAPLAALLPAEWRGTPALWQGSLDFQAAASGPPTALAARMAVTLDDGRIEMQPVIDFARGTWRGPVTLRHPGAVRLLSATGLLPGADWLGEGSLSLVAQLSGAPGRVAAEDVEITAGSLRGAGRLALDRTAARPRLEGELDFATLPLPLPLLAAPLPLQGLRAWQASVRIAAAQLLVGQRPLLDHLAATVLLDAGRLRIEPLAAGLAGGALQGSVVLDISGETPTVTLDGAAAGFSLTEPATGLPLDLASGQGSAQLRVVAEGNSPAAMLATLSGTASFSVTDGALAGLDLSGAAAAVAADAAGTEPPQAVDDALRAALTGGTTPFQTFAVRAGIGHGVLSLTDARLTAPAGIVLFSGVVGLPLGSCDLRAEVHPTGPDMPVLGVRLTGPLDAPRRIPELAGFARWRADHPAP
jgi:hypothetical protein